MRKLKLLSLSGSTANSAVFFSPSEAKSNSSWEVREARRGKLNADKRTAMEMMMLIAVLPGACL